MNSANPSFYLLSFDIMFSSVFNTYVIVKNDDKNVGSLIFILKTV